MTNPRVNVLTIFFPSRLPESARSITHTILRRRADGPLLVRDREPDTAQNPRKDWGKPRYTSERPHIQAFFTDQEALDLVQAELLAFVPDLPEGVVRRERRRLSRPELPCTCVLPCPRGPRPEGVTGAPRPFPVYQVETCQRHAHLLPKPCARPMAEVVRHQVLELVEYLPGPASMETPLLLDEPLALIARPNKPHAAAHLVADLAREGRKFALYG